MSSLSGKVASPRVLMCRPEWFEVSYQINAFMEGNQGKVDRDLALRQWDDLHAKISAAGVRIELIQPQAQPDFVFTANAGLVWRDTVIPARFFHPERRGEEKYFVEWFRKNGFQIAEIPENEFFEGEGDVVVRDEFAFMGHASRTSSGAANTVSRVTGLEVVSLVLNPHEFYHLDTCMVSQGDKGIVFYYPGAFTADDLGKIRSRIRSEQLIEVSREEALCFACNMVIAGDGAIFPASPPSLTEKIERAGLGAVSVDLSEFMKAGGAAKCLTLWLEKG